MRIPGTAGMRLMAACAAVAWLPAWAAVAQRVRIEPTGRNELEVASSFNTGEEFERMLDRADQLAAAGRPDLAPVLWQRVFDEGGNILAAQSDGVCETLLHVYRRYRPLKEEVERRILAAGPEALRQYRIRADVEARALLANHSSIAREVALAEVVRRYLLSVVGDDAAFELGCRQLERREFALALPYFNMLQDLPDSSIPQQQVTSRLAIIHAQLGDRGRASALCEATRALDPALANLIATDPAPSPRADVASVGVSTSPELSSASRQFDVRNIASYSELWSYEPACVLAQPPPEPATVQTVVAVINGRRVAIRLDRNGQAIGGAESSARDLPSLTRSELVELWRAKGWQPVGQLLVAGNRVLMKSEDRIVCCDGPTGRVLWMGRKNHLRTEQALQSLLILEQIAGRSTNGESSGPRSRMELTLFGDRLAQSMAAAGELVFNLEGAFDDDLPREPQANSAAALQRRMMSGDWADTSLRSWLAAYDLGTGKLRWYRAPADDDGNTVTDDAFLSAPVPWEDRLIVALGDDTHISLALLEQSTGKTVWRSPLCDSPIAGRDPFVNVGIVAEQGRIYVSTGSGAVFAVDPLNGGIVWAATYPRQSFPGADSEEVLGLAMANRRDDSRGFEPPGFEENVILRTGSQLIVLATDFSYAFALAATDGAFCWEAPLAPLKEDPAVTYVVGCGDGGLFLGGPRVIRRYDLQGGRLQWERPLDQGLGRGILSSTALLIPDADQVRRLDPATGLDLGALAVNTSEQEPVGNLYQDGTRLWVVNPARISALVPGPYNPEPQP